MEIDLPVEQAAQHSVQMETSLTKGGAQHSKDSIQKISRRMDSSQRTEHRPTKRNRPGLKPSYHRESAQEPQTRARGGRQRSFESISSASRRSRQAIPQERATGHDSPVPQLSCEGLRALSIYLLLHLPSYFFFPVTGASGSPKFRVENSSSATRFAASAKFQLSFAAP